MDRSEPKVEAILEKKYYKRVDKEISWELQPFLSTFEENVNEVDTDIGN